MLQSWVVAIFWWIDWYFNIFLYRACIACIRLSRIRNENEETENGKIAPYIKTFVLHHFSWLLAVRAKCVFSWFLQLRAKGNEYILPLLPSLNLLHSISHFLPISLKWPTPWTCFDLISPAFAFRSLPIASTSRNAACPSTLRYYLLPSCVFRRNFHCDSSTLVSCTGIPMFSS